MEFAGKAYAQNPDPDTKLGDLETMELSRLKILHNRYKNIASNRALVSRLKDRGESARRTLAAVEAELATRASAGDSEPPALESRRAAAAAAAEVEKLAQRIARIEWTGGRRTGQREELDSDDDPDPEEMPPAPSATSSSPDISCAARLAPSPASPGAGAAAATTRQLLPKSATSRRETRFLTNRVRVCGGEVPSPPVPGPERRTVLAQWSDSSLAGPARPDTHTQLLDMDESLQLLSHHSRVTQEERAAQVAARYANIEGGHIDVGSEEEMDDADGGPAVFVGVGAGS